MKIFRKSTAPTLKMGIFSATFEEQQVGSNMMHVFLHIIRLRFYACAMCVCMCDLQIEKINEIQRYFVDEIECCSHS